ncbi:MAG: sulfotransferase family protein [Thermodesulfobacteriota bacterium]
MGKKKIVCITGMERSGTSMVARIANLLGVYLGGRDGLIMETDYNLKGCWENKTLLKISDDILTRFGGHNHLLPDFADGWIDEPKIADLEAKARQTIKSEFSNKDAWGWKDPRSCLVMPFWQKLLPEMEYVICIRNPKNVADSLVTGEWASSYAEAYWIWHMYTSNIIRHTAGKRRIFVFYEDFMGKDSMSAIRRLADFLGPEYVEKVHKAASKIESFITKGLQHYETPLMATLQDVDMPLAIKAYYLSLLLLEKGGIESLGTVEAAAIINSLSLHKDKELTALGELALTKKELEEKKRRLRALLDSGSWRITAPLRKVIDILKKPK